MITLADWRYTNVQKIDPNFYNDLQFKNGFESVVSIGSKYTFSFNEQVTRPKGNFRSFIGNFEAVGSGVSKLLDQRNTAGTDASTVFGVRATQYLRFDADFAYFWKLPEGQSIVSRIYFGLLYAMGNGRYILPFDKSFFGGGTNDNRAWPAYRLGPGGYRNSAGNVNIAPLKIMGNIEYRFPIVRALKSALFLDFGNIWIIQPDLPVYAAFKDLKETQFAFSSFMDQMAIGLGSGLRYDVGFFVVRLDVGWPLRYPYDPEGERGQWAPRPLSWNECTYNIGIGYPF
jgi:outer membrane protein assembly factor BamA